MLAAVVEWRVQHHTVSIASVSGGSIANSAVAVAGDFPQGRRRCRARRVGRATLRVVAIDGLFLPGTPTRGYVTRTLAALVVAGCSLLGLTVVTDSGWTRPCVVGVRHRRRTRRFPRRCGDVEAHHPSARRRVLLGTAVGAAVAGAVAQMVNHLDGRAVAVVRAGRRSAVDLLRRGRVVGAQSARLSRGRGSAPTVRLAPGSQIRICDRSTRPSTTCSARPTSNPRECLFFAPRFAYGFRHGLADMQHNPLTVAAVTQASAAVPPGFPPVALDVVGFVLPPDHPSEHTVAAMDRRQQVKVSDGGVYDNLGDEWEVGFEQRARSVPSTWPRSSSRRTCCWLRMRRGGSDGNRSPPPGSSLARSGH